MTSETESDVEQEKNPAGQGHPKNILEHSGKLLGAIWTLKHYTGAFWSKGALWNTVKNAVEHLEALGSTWKHLWSVLDMEYKNYFETLRSTLKHYGALRNTWKYYGVWSTTLEHSGAR